MWNNDHESSQGLTRWGLARRWFAICVLAGALLPALGTAQTSGGPTTVLKSGLHSIFEGHTLLLTVTEVGSTTSTSTVTVEFLDALDQRRGFVSGTLKRKGLVQLPVAIPAGAGYQRLRAIVKITPLTNGAGSEPIVGLEDLDITSKQVIPKGLFSVGPIDNDGAEGDCGGGWQVTRVSANP